MVERQVEQLARLVDALLDVSRITHGKIEPRKETVELSRVVKDAVDTCRSLIETRELDIGLPGMNGYEVARRLREQGDLEGTMLVAVTGYGQEEDRLQALAAGFDHHLVKPVDLADLQQLLAAACPG